MFGVCSLPVLASDQWLVNRINAQVVAAGKLASARMRDHQERL